ncbi:MAG: thiamine phosphate synthase [Bacteroidota bacterium]
MLHKIQYISQGNTAEEQLRNIREVLEAGGRWIQLRYKNPNEILAVAKEVKALCAQFNALFIINDFVEIAKEVDADGVHLGLQDTSIEKARAVLGSEKIIGGTANTLEDVKQRIEEGCDYIGLGPFRFTTTKQSLSPILGLEGYQSILNQLNSSVPIFAIGGIETDDVEAILSNGIYGIALSGLISNSSDKKLVLTTLNTIVNGTVENRR